MRFLFIFPGGVGRRVVVGFVVVVVTASVVKKPSPDPSPSRVKFRRNPVDAVVTSSGGRTHQSSQADGQSQVSRFSAIIPIRS